MVLRLTGADCTESIRYRTFCADFAADAAIYTARFVNYMLFLQLSSNRQYRAIFCAKCAAYTSVGYCV